MPTFFTPLPSECSMVKPTVGLVWFSSQALGQYFSISRQICSGLSFRRRSRCFRQDMGLTPHKYIVQLKIEAAKNWLDGGCTAAAVAERLRFASAAAFSTFFKNATGVSPSQYRAHRQA